MKRTLLFLMCLWAILAGWTVYAQSNEAERLRDAAKILEETMNVPDKAIPAAILAKAEAVAVFPSVIKAGLGIGGQHGRGVLSARNSKTGAWSQPAFLSLTGGSFGAQIGAQAIDLVLVVLNRRGLDNLLKNEFKIGADASVAAGPVGRGAEASTDIQFRAEILSYSRARGLFAGVTLNGSAIQEDEDANRRFYGRPVSNRDLIDQGPRPVGTTGSEATEAINVWHQALARYAK